MSVKDKISALVEKKQELFLSVSDKVWGFAELGMKEFQSAGVLTEALESEGFEVEKGLASIPTAFCGTYGNGKPVIGFLGEFDALPNLSQEADCPEQKQLVEGGSGHGCGHNILGAGALAAAVAFKDYLRENGLPGTVKYFGCPGEEFGCGKAFMARAGCFDDVDCSLTWHPGDTTCTWSTSCLANMSVFFSFSGKTAHAAAAPHAGRSALDAAELMNVGVNFLREHIIPEARVHYAFHDAGGQAPNVVQDRAKLHYYIRAPKREQAQQIFERIQKVAYGAAMMTETECTVKFKDGLSDYLPNQTITKIMNDAMEEIGPVPFDEEDRNLAKRFWDTMADHNAGMLAPFGGMELSKSYEAEGTVLFDDVLPYKGAHIVVPGSTDVGDVSYVTPTAQLVAASACLGTGTHTWQMTAQVGGPIGHKAVLYAGKAIALTAVRLLENPSLLEEAKGEFQKATGGKKYKPLFPDDIMPTLD